MDDRFQSDRPAIAVVGLGPRGMILVERLLALAGARPDLDLDLLLFGPGQPGPGLHRPDLPDYLMLNTVAGQLSFFPHAEAVGGAPHRAGPALDEWCRENGLSVDEEGSVGQGAGRPVAPGDFLPRRVLGEYLAECAGALLAAPPPNVRIRRVADEIVNAGFQRHGARHWLQTASGACFSADIVFLALGHTGQTARPGETRPEAIGAGESVAIAGIGLTAMDMVAGLTRGRGGRFVREGGPLRYLRSGREPAITLHATTGLPFHARPDWSPEDAAQRPAALFFTRAAVDRLRLRAPGGRLDFRSDLLPLIELEMRAAYHQTAARIERGGEAATEIARDLALLADDPGLAAGALDALDRRQGRFDPGRYTRIAAWEGAPEDYEGWYCAYLAADLHQARLGVTGSPVKAALEVWRNERDTLRHAVNGQGLTDAARADFYRHYAPVSNRLVGGPQKERHAELLALVEAGVVRLLPPRAMQAVTPPGPADHVLTAYVGSSGIPGSASALLRSLAAQGRIRPVSAEIGGIDADAHGQPVAADGTVDGTVWIVGPNLEGASFYNHYVGTPDPRCPLFVDAQREVTRCLNRIEAQARHRDDAAPRRAAP